MLKYILTVLLLGSCFLEVGFAESNLRISPDLIPNDVSSISDGVLYAPTADFQASVVLPNVDSIPSRNVWQAYRKTFTLDSVPQQALCRIATDSKYWLYVNGTLVVLEGGLKRGPSPNACYYDEIDLKPYLKTGKNTLAALVWFFGKEGFSHKNSGQPGFLFDAACNGNDGLFLVSDATWKGWILTKTTETGENQPFDAVTADPQPNFRLPESHIRYDARREPSGWMKEEFNDESWPCVKVVSTKAETPWGPLYRRPYKQWKFGEIQPFASVKETINENGTKTLMCRLPYNMQQTPWFRAEAAGGEELTLKTDSYMVGDAPCLRFEYVCKPGTQEFEFPEWLSGNQLEITVPASVRVLETGFRKSGFPTEFTGTLTCDDSFYVRLYDRAQKTLHITMRDTYMDCPDRERALWWGDAVNEMGEAFYALDREADLLAKKGFYELMRFQKPDGVVFAPIPAGNWEKELPAQMLATVSTYGLGTYTLYSGDAGVAVDLYPRTLRYLSLWDFDADGLVKVRAGGWSWADWGEDIDLRLILNAWYSLALDQAIQTGETVRTLKNGEGDAALQKLVQENPSLAAMNIESVLQRLYAQKESLKKNFNRVFWTGKSYRSPEYKGATDDRSNAMAFLAGFAVPEQFEALRTLFHTEFHASPYMEKYVLEAMFRLGDGSGALKRMKERYSEMILSDEFTTLWEGWGHGAIPRGTFNHAWSGGGLTCLIQYAIGLEPTKPAFREFTLHPQMGELRQLATTVETHFGLITIRLEKDASNVIHLCLTVPEGTTAKIPTPDGEKTFSSGTWETVISEGRPLR